MNIILIGYKSCGKSTVGAALAEQLGMTFVDTDRLLERQHTASTGEILSFREIYQQRGKEYFAELERQVVDYLAALDGYVIASGGQTFLNHPPGAAMRARSTIIYLDVAPAILLERIKAGGTPAFFEKDDVEASFSKLYAERHPRYQQLADHSLPASHRTVAELVGQIVAILPP